MKWIWKKIIKLMPMRYKYQIMREEIRSLGSYSLAELVSQERRDIHIHKNPPKTAIPKVKKPRKVGITSKTQDC